MRLQQDNNMEDRFNDITMEITMRALLEKLQKEEENRLLDRNIINEYL